MKLQRHELLAIALAADLLGCATFTEMKTRNELSEIVERHRCPVCFGSTRMVRDPDIGTDQECTVCDGTGVNDDD